MSLQPYRRPAWPTRRLAEPPADETPEAGRDWPADPPATGRGLTARSLFWLSSDFSAQSSAAARRQILFFILWLAQRQQQHPQPSPVPERRRAWQTACYGRSRHARPTDRTLADGGGRVPKRSPAVIIPERTSRSGRFRWKVFFGEVGRGGFGWGDAQLSHAAPLKVMYA